MVCFFKILGHLHILYFRPSFAISFSLSLSVSRQHRPFFPRSVPHSLPLTLSNLSSFFPEPKLTLALQVTHSASHSPSESHSSNHPSLPLRLLGQSRQYPPSLPPSPSHRPIKLYEPLLRNQLPDRNRVKFRLYALQAVLKGTVGQHRLQQMLPIPLNRIRRRPP